MQRESNWRYYLILIVTVLCLIFIWPTVSYITFLFTQQPPSAQGMAEADYQKALTAYEDEKDTRQRKAISLGLDLIGGVDVLLRVDADKMQSDLLASQRESLRRELAEKQISAQIQFNEKRDALTIKLADKANAQRLGNVLQDYVKGDTIQAIDEGALRATGEATVRLSPKMLNNRLGDSIESAVRSIRNRVDEFGVTQPSVSLQKDTNSIRVQVPGEKDPEYVINQIIKPAQLEFYLLHEQNDQLAAQLFEKVEVEGPRGEKREEFKLRQGAQLPPGYRGMRGEMTRQNEKTHQMETTEMMYIVKERPEMTGEHLQDAWVQTLQRLANPIVVSLSFDREGARQFHRVTSSYLKRRLAIALDGVIYSAPVLQSAIANGQAIIEGNFQPAEARDLTLVLRAGALPADLKPVSERAVGPTLGAESIKQSLKALMIGAACVTGFMVIYYGTAGVISVIALALNLLVIMACMNLFGATLTLSGIGGIILTLGMAVDANVLIYERIREEIRGGRTAYAAIRGGFGRAFSVIFDSNLTTLLAALVLLQFGEGTVQGFALTMTFGLLANLFTGLTVTFALCALWFSWRGKLSLGVLHIFRNPKYNFIGMRRATFPLSALMVTGAIVILVLSGGPQYAVDFRGGVLSEVRMLKAEGDAQAEMQKLNAALNTIGADQARIQRVETGGGHDYLIRLALQTPEGATDGDVTYTKKRLRTALLSQFSKDEIDIARIEGVSREVSQGFREIAVMVIIAASICILIYLWFRFELVFGAAAVVALIHDLTITVGLITLFKVQISLDVVSALLILLGFSVNDTIVIFDRIRENTHTMFGHSFKDICNDAMNKSLSRTFITSLTTIGVMLIMYFLGGHSLAPFALTLIIGGVIGTYSSDFLATPLVYWWNERQQGRLVEELGRKNAGQPAPDSVAATPLPAGAAGDASGAPQQTRRRGRR